MNVLLSLMLVFLQIGFLSIGGGYATISLIQKIIVTDKGWLTIKEFTDIITISQMTPGPLTVNSSTFVGLQVEGLAGAIVATLSVIIPGCIISLLLSSFFRKNQKSDTIQKVFVGLEAVAIGLILSASISIVAIAFFGEMTLRFDLEQLNYIAVLLFTASFVALRKWKINPMIILVFTGFLGFILYM